MLPSRSKAHEAERLELERKIEEYLKSGGTITEVPNNKFSFIKKDGSYVNNINEKRQQYKQTIGEGE